MGLKPPIDQAGTKFDHHGRPSLTHRSGFDLASFLTRAGGYRIHVFFLLSYYALTNHQTPRLPHFW